MEQNKVEILEALNNEKMYSLRGDEVGEMCSPEGNDTCGDGRAADEKSPVIKGFCGFGAEMDVCFCFRRAGMGKLLYPGG
ncbi:hypothetical protein [Frisingicoccus sp.]|uniref:hypothetical protein n=1 Tax=Frisingicoccus sp. TaxID=1918627 RepID=UPI003AB7BB34